MSKKVLAIYAGRNRQYSEFLAKTALLGAAEAGAEVEAVNITNLNLKPCNGCKSCHMTHIAAVGDCVIRDDFQWLDEKIMESDALVVCMPIYEKTPPGEFKILMDRTGPSHDIAFRAHAKKMREQKEFSDGRKVDERSFKKRPVYLIAHGGSDWGSLAMPVMELWAIPMGHKIVNMDYIPWNLNIFFDDEKLNEIRQTGKQLVESIGEDNPKYIGSKGICPVCHNSTMNLLGGLKVECSVCSAKGTLKIENGDAVVDFPEDEIRMSQMLDGGREKHYRDIDGFGEIVRSMDLEKLNKRKVRYMDWLKTSQPDV